MINESLYDCIVIITVRISLYIYIYASLSKPPLTTQGYVMVEGGRSVCTSVCLQQAMYVFVYLSPPVVGVCGSVGGSKVSVCMYACMHVGR